MKKEDLMDAVGMADEAYIEEAAPGKIQPVRGGKFIKFIPLIAAAFVVACLGLFMKDRWLMKSAVTEEAAGALKEAANDVFEADGAVSEDTEECAVEECAAEAEEALPEPEASMETTTALAETAAALEEPAADMAAPETCAETLAVAMEETLAAEPAVIYEYDEDGVRYELTEISELRGFPYTMLLYIEGDPDIYDKLSLQTSESGESETFVFPKQAGKPAGILIAYRDAEALKKDRLTLTLYPTDGKTKTVTAEPGKLTAESEISDRFSEVIDSVMSMYNFK